jgi:hypothetical protein
VLVGELGIEPGPELQRLQAAILSHDAELERGRQREVPCMPTDVCPYKGLARFETVDAGSSSVGSRWSRRRSVTSSGEGSSRSSDPRGAGSPPCCAAGLMHALGSGALPGSDRWAYSVIPTGQPSARCSG